MGAGVFVGGVLGFGAVCSNVLAARHQRKCHPAPLVVATDLEPDDCLALLMLRMRGITPKAVMVGEGCAPLKVKRMQMLAPMLGWHNTRIVQGMSSTTSALEYVEEGTCGDAAGCTTAGGDAAVCTAPVSWVAFLADLLDTGPDFREEDSTWEGWLAHKLDPHIGGARGSEPNLVREPTFLFLKPPRELVAAQEQDPAGAKALFGRARLVLYGSFNLRQVGYGSVVSWLDPATTPFRRVILHENHGCLYGDGSMKPLSRDTMVPWGKRYGRMPTPEHKQDPGLAEYVRRMRAFMVAWDNHVLRDCNDTCAEIEAREGWRDSPTLRASWHRNRSCADAIAPFLGQQIAAADPALAAMLDDYVFNLSLRAIEKASWTAGQPYMTLTVSDKSEWYAEAPSKVVRYKELEEDDVLWELFAPWSLLFPE